MFFSLGFGYFLIEFWEFFIYFRYKPFVRKAVCRYFLPVYDLFLNSVFQSTSLKFWWNLAVFSFINCIADVVSKKSFLMQSHKDFSPAFFFNSLHFELVFLYRHFNVELQRSYKMKTLLNTSSLCSTSFFGKGVTFPFPVKLLPLLWRGRFSVCVFLKNIAKSVFCQQLFVQVVWNVFFAKEKCITLSLHF